MAAVALAVGANRSDGAQLECMIVRGLAHEDDQLGDLRGIDALGIMDEAAGIRERDDLRPELDQLLRRELRDVAGARDEADRKSVV